MFLFFFFFFCTCARAVSLFCVHADDDESSAENAEQNAFFILLYKDVIRTIHSFNRNERRRKRTERDTSMSRPRCELRGNSAIRRYVLFSLRLSLSLSTSSLVSRRIPSKLQVGKRLTGTERGDENRKLQALTYIPYLFYIIQAPSVQLNTTHGIVFPPPLCCLIK